MEVASPLPFGPSPAGNKRSLACSPQLIQGPTDGFDERATKRRRFYGASDVDSLSEHFSSHSLLFKNRTPVNTTVFPVPAIGGCSASTRIRSPEVFAPTIDRQQELNEVIHEQTSLIESLKADKTEIEKSLSSLKTDHERVTKENHILRRAVTIQEERRVNSEQEIKSVRAQNDERIRALEQIILSLRYHLQAQHDVGNDFMHPRPPDVF